MDNEGRLDVVDVSQIEGVHVHAFVRFEQQDPSESHFWEEWSRPEMTKDQEKRVEELVGDGMASITVGTDMKTSADFGNAAGCSVYVKLTCNQDAESIVRAHGLAEELALRFMDDGHLKAARILNSARGLPDPDSVDQRGGAPAKAKKVVAPKEHSVAKPAKTKVKSKKKVTAKKKVGPKKAAMKVGPKKKSGPAPKTKGTKKPNFRRN